MGRLRVNVFGTKHLRSQNTMLLTRLRSHTRLLNSAYLFWKHPRQFPVVEARRELLHETTREGRTKLTRTIHPSTFSTRYFLSLWSRGWAGASASCHRVAAEWHPGQVQTRTVLAFFLDGRNSYRRPICRDVFSLMWFMLIFFLVFFVVSSLKDAAVIMLTNLQRSTKWLIVSQNISGKNSCNHESMI